MDMNKYSSGRREFFGGTVCFIDAIKKCVDDYMISKVVVFWDGIFSGKNKYEKYPEVKQIKQKRWDMNQRMASVMESELSDKELQEYHVLQQKLILQKYLDSLFVRQVELETLESFDAMGFYQTQAKEVGEELYIIGRPELFFQTLESGSNVILIQINKDDEPMNISLVNADNFYKIFEYNHTNDLMLRCITGMPSTCVKGIKMVTPQKVLSHFPGFKVEHYSYHDLIVYIRKKMEEKPLRLYESILDGYSTIKRNARLINLNNPMIDAKERGEVSVALYDPFDVQSKSSAPIMKYYRKKGYEHFVNQDLFDYFCSYARIATQEREYEQFIKN